jgi:hypothetical protein
VRPLATGGLVTLGFTRLATLGLIPEALVSKKKLLTCRKDELRSAVNTFQHSVPIFHVSLSSVDRTSLSRRTLARLRLVLFVPRLLASPLPGQGSLDPFLFARLEIKGMSFYLLDDVFLLNLALETPQSVF